MRPTRPTRQQPPIARAMTVRRPLSPLRLARMRVPSRAALYEPLAVALVAPLLLFPTAHPHWTAAALAALALVWLARWLVTRTPAVPTSLDAALLLFAVMVCVGVWVSPLPHLALPRLTGLILGLAVFRATANAVRTARHLVPAVALFLLLGVALAFLGLFTTNWLHKLPAFEPILALFPRVPILPAGDDGIHPNVLGGTLILFLPVALSAVALPSSTCRWRRWTPRLAALLLALLLSTLLVLAQSRSAWIGAAAGLVAMAWLSCPQLRVPLAAASLLLPLALLYFGPQQVLHALGAARDAGAIATTANLEPRLELWSRALDVIQAFPLTGCGLGTFHRVAPILYPLFHFDPGAGIGHAHNLYLQVAVDLGLPGLVAYLALAGTALWLSWRAAHLAPPRLRPLATGLLGSLVAFHVYGLTDAGPFVARPAFVFWLVLGLVVALHRVSSQGGPPRSPCPPSPSTPAGDPSPAGRV